MRPRTTSLLLALIAITVLATAACRTTETDAAVGSAGELRAGAASRTITPEGWEPWTDVNENNRFDGDLDDPEGTEPFVDLNGNGRFDTYWLAGSHSGRAVSAVHDDLEVTVTVFSDGDRTVALAGVDALTSRIDLTNQVRSELLAQGVEIDSFNWTSSHSHESLAPLPSEFGGVSFPAEDYWEFVVGQVVEATVEAYHAQEPATLILADARTPLEAGASLQADLRDPNIIDNTVTIMRFDRADDSGVISTIVHWGNHPEMTSWDTQVSADFPGSLRRRLEAEYAGSVAVFLQGSVGSQITAEDATFSYAGVDYTDLEGPWSPGSFEKADAVGNYVADIVIDSLETSGVTQQDCGITAADHQSVLVAVDNPEVLAAAADLGAEFFDADGSPHSNGNPVHLADEVGHIAICDLEILTNPSEVAPELVIGCYDGTCANPDQNFMSDENPTRELTVFPEGPFWKDEMSARYRMVTSLTNGLAGYLVAPSNWALDPVRPWGFWGAHHYDETSSFSVKNAAIFDAAYRDLLDLDAVDRPPAVSLDTATLDRYVGTYGDRLEIERSEKGLRAFLRRFGTTVDLVAESETRFFDHLLGLTIEFAVDESGFATSAEVLVPGEGLVRMEATGPGPLVGPSIAEQGIEIVFEQIGVSTVAPRGWLRTEDGVYSEGISRLGAFALPTSAATDLTADGFEPVGELTATGRPWSLYMRDGGQEIVGLAVTEIGDSTYGLFVEAPTDIAEYYFETILVPALEAFEADGSEASEGSAGLDPTNIQIDGRNIAYVSSGGGSPTVVFEAGLGNGMETWALVAPSVANVASVFAYDRPGYGGSDLTDGPRDAAAMVAELREILAETGHQPPYLLVGHSLGGTVMDLFARTHPDEVAGLVLVDSRHHEFTSRCIALLGEAGCHVPTEAEVAVAPRPIREEWLALGLTEEQLGEAPPFPDVPLVVIVAGIAESSPAYADLWREAQEDYAAMAPRSRLVIAERSDHGIPVQQPQVIADVIVDLTKED